MSHFTLTIRKTLSHLLKGKHTYKEIALVIRKSKSSISDEIKRNSGGKEKYDAYDAHGNAEMRWLNKKKRKKLEISFGLREYVIEKIEKDWAPEQIAGVLREEAKGKTVISHETIYQFVYSDEGKKLKLWKHLRHKKRPERQAWGSRKKRTIIPNRVSIQQRPQVINRRERFGDFEGDLMVFSSSSKALAVFVERCTRKIFSVLNDDKTAKEMEYALHEMVCSAGIHLVNSITFDNGGENVCHEKIREDYEYKFTTYFCDPYSSWQKGAVENANKLLRQYFPRDISPELLTQDYVDTIVQKINNRPRKCLKYSTPEKIFNSCSV